MERLQKFVSSRGLLKSCRLHDPAPRSGQTEIAYARAEDVAPGSSIYVCTDALKSFADSLLDRIEAPFVLVSGDSDRALSPATIGAATFDKIMNSNHLLAWYAQNLATAADGRLKPLPIGLDYHSQWNGASSWGLGRVAPFAQEKTLIDTLDASPRLEERFAAAYCNWHLNVNSDARRDCLDKIDRSLCYLEKGYLPRNGCWARQSQFMFVLSPPGIGLDCHRTWEALALGCIPIVQQSAFSGLFAELPVLLVEDWRQISRSFLEESGHRLLQRKFRYSGLFLEPWRRRIAGEEAEILEAMTIAEFRAAMTRTSA